MHPFNFFLILIETDSNNNRIAGKSTIFVQNSRHRRWILRLRLTLLCCRLRMATSGSCSITKMGNRAGK
ncbi:MAG: hypothetical protein CVV42_01785 [Candidatus Riflebacteria bacterium HGW-Riflebacteria-2]|nr:MAG: hypothetical protein CVV42_01785 [Candidatus Riflebacteria bacterium HGW-Riflebacteria-2]